MPVQPEPSLTSFSSATAATGSVAATMAPNSRLCGQLQPYGKIKRTTTAVMAVPAFDSMAAWVPHHNVHRFVVAHDLALNADDLSSGEKC